MNVIAVGLENRWTFDVGERLNGVRERLEWDKFMTYLRYRKSFWPVNGVPLNNQVM